MRFRPRTPWLDPFSARSVRRWADLPDEALGPGLDRAGLERVAHRLLDAWQATHPASFAEDAADPVVPWQEDFVPAPGYQWARVWLPDLGWWLELTVPDADTRDDGLDEPLATAPELVETEQGLTLQDEQFTIDLSPRSVRVRSSDEIHDHVWGVVIGEASGFACERPRTAPRSSVHLAFEPIACARCGEEADAPEASAYVCSGCGGVDAVAKAPVVLAAATGDSDERLVQALIACGAIEVSSVAEVAKLLGSRPESPFSALLASEHVIDVYVSADVLNVLVTAW